MKRNSDTVTTFGVAPRSAEPRLSLPELARAWRLAVPDLEDRVRKLGLSTSGELSADEVERLRQELGQAAPLVEKRVSATVIRRRRLDQAAAEQTPASKTSPAPEARYREAPEAKHREPSMVAPAKPEVRRVPTVVITGSAATGRVVPLPGRSTPGRPQPARDGRGQPLRRQEPARPAARSPAAGAVSSAGPTAPAAPSTPPPREVAPAPVEVRPVVKEIRPVVITGKAATGRFISLPKRPQPARRPAPTGRRAVGPKSTTRARPPGPATPSPRPAEHKRVLRLSEQVSVLDLAQRLSVKATEIIRRLWSLGMMGVTINQVIDFDTAALVAGELGYEVQSSLFNETDVLGTAAPDRPEDLVARPPVITVMGHVDHGKTSLLDAIRRTDVAAREAGGITQHIGAHRVRTPHGLLVFLDTPGHEAFTAMRARGARATDLVVLVVAADDGPRPQTIEALQHARAAGVPILVAVNKIDKPGADPQAVRERLMAHDLVPEELGGRTVYVDVSAKTRAGIDRLLEMLALSAEVLELRANPRRPAHGVIVEARLDRARGPVATVLVQNGTLHVGDQVVAGASSGRVRAMADDAGQPTTHAGPAAPVEILGLDAVPAAGEPLDAVADEHAARTVAQHRRDERRRREAGVPRVSLESIFDRVRQGEVRELKLVLKADVQGSVEALTHALRGLATPQVGIDVIASGVGGITESDVTLARASSAIVLGFGVRAGGKAAKRASEEGVEIKRYEVIYDLLDDVRKAMAGLLSPVTRERTVGRAEVRQVFSLSRGGAVAGCVVLEGQVLRRAEVRLRRAGAVLFTGRLASLRRFKDDVASVDRGQEFGAVLEGWNDLRAGDLIESVERETVAATLESPRRSSEAPAPPPP